MGAIPFYRRLTGLFWGWHNLCPERVSTIYHSFAPPFSWCRTITAAGCVLECRGSSTMSHNHNLLTMLDYKFTTFFRRNSKIYQANSNANFLLYFIHVLHLSKQFYALLSCYFSYYALWKEGGVTRVLGHVFLWRWKSTLEIIVIVI